MAADAVRRAGRLDDHRGRDDRERRDPLDHPRHRHLGDRRRVGQLHLLARLRGAAAHDGPGRGHLRTSPALPAGHRRVRRGQPGRRPGAVRRGAHPGPVPAGRRRGDAAARVAVHGERPVPGQGPSDRVRDLGSHDRRHRRARPAARRLAHHGVLLALGVPDQPADRGARRLRPAALRARDEGPGRAPRRRPARHGHLGRGPRCAGVRAHRGPALRVVAADGHLRGRRAALAVHVGRADRRGLRRRCRVARGVLADRAPAGTARGARAARPAAVHHPQLPVRQRGGADRLAGRVRPAVRAAAVPAERAGLLGAADRGGAARAGHGDVPGQPVRGPDRQLPRRADRRPARAGARGGRHPGHRRLRGGGHQRLAAGPVAAHLRGRRRPGHGPAHRRDPRGHRRRGVRPGLSGAEHLPPGGRRPGHGHPGRGAVHLARVGRGRPPAAGRSARGAGSADRHRGQGAAVRGAAGAGRPAGRGGGRRRGVRGVRPGPPATSPGPAPPSCCSA